MISELVQQFSPESEEVLTNGESSQENNRKRKRSSNDKDVSPNKFIRSIIQERIKKYITGDINNSGDDVSSDNSDVDDDATNENINPSEK